MGHRAETECRQARDGRTAAKGQGELGPVVGPETVAAIGPEASANADGHFSFPDLSFGKFEITVTAAGFQTSVVANVSVEASKTTDVPIQLQVGQQSQQSPACEQGEQQASERPLPAGPSRRRALRGGRGGRIGRQRTRARGRSARARSENPWTKAS